MSDFVAKCPHCLVELRIQKWAQARQAPCPGCGKTLYVRGVGESALVQATSSTREAVTPVTRTRQQAVATTKVASSGIGPGADDQPVFDPDGVGSTRMESVDWGQSEPHFVRGNFPIARTSPSVPRNGSSWRVLVVVGALGCVAVAAGFMWRIPALESRDADTDEAPMRRVISAEFDKERTILDKLHELKQSEKEIQHDIEDLQAELKSIDQKMAQLLGG